jgi:hypothetical protein
MYKIYKYIYNNICLFDNSHAKHLLNLLLFSQLLCSPQRANEQWKRHEVRVLYYPQYFFREFRFLPQVFTNYINPRSHDELALAPEVHIYWVMLGELDGCATNFQFLFNVTYLLNKLTCFKTVIRILYFDYVYCSYVITVGIPLTELSTDSIRFKL